MSCCDICDELAAVRSDLAELKAKMTLLLQHCGPQTPPPPGGFAVDAVTFDGTNDYLTRGGVLTGVSDASTGILSFWVKVAADGTDQDIFRNDASGIYLLKDNAGTLTFGLSEGLFIDFIQHDIANGLLAANGWVHILASWNVNAAAGARTFNVYRNDVLVNSLSSDQGSAFSVDYTATEWAIGFDLDAILLNGDLAEFYFAPGQSIDLTVEANRRKFRSAAGEPVDLGADGSTPTGTAPAVYLHIDDGEAAANFAVNAGSGGNFTVTGALATAGTSPSD